MNTHYNNFITMLAENSVSYALDFYDNQIMVIVSSNNHCPGEVHYRFNRQTKELESMHWWGIEAGVGEEYEKVILEEDDNDGL